LNCNNKPELRERLAAEYVLGTLRGRARDRMRRWLREDAALARAVAEWEARLTPLAQAVQPVRAPARVWDGIEARLGSTEAGSSRRSGWWDRVGFWRPLGILASGAMAALLAVVVLLPAEKAPPAESMPAAYIAVLSDPKTQRPVLVATAARQDARLSVRALDPAILVAGRSLELWAVPRKGGPKSLGLVEAEHATLQLAAAADRSLGDIPLLAVSLEPKGGSPTGAPTGPVLYSGPCVKYW
jgi:anti-sigma-K factor RskA